MQDEHKGMMCRTACYKHAHVLQLLFVNNQEMAFSFLRYTAVTKITIYNTPLFVDFFFF